MNILNFTYSLVSFAVYFDTENTSVHVELVKDNSNTSLTLVWNGM